MSYACFGRFLILQFHGPNCTMYVFLSCTITICMFLNWIKDLEVSRKVEKKKKKKKKKTLYLCLKS
ncbi:hypothetical protein HanRHA438_Chr10g0473801 [Helianthus annuus]|nr:hypothetical protein HanRHA438_Chr10g0473801 [Helianthus annuus]